MVEREKAKIKRKISLVGMGIPCPHCHSVLGLKTIDTRPTEGSIRRRRVCSCGHRFSTYELMSERYEQLILMDILPNKLRDIGSDLFNTANNIDKYIVDGQNRLEDARMMGSKERRRRGTEYTTWMKSRTQGN